MEENLTISQKRVSDVVDLKRDILPYRLIQLVAGVGAGKNFWVRECLSKGKNPKTKKLFNVLLITSRAITADVQAANMEANRWIDLEALQKKGIGTKGHKTAVVTNSGIEYFIKNRYQKDDPTTHIWNYFDFIILDEAHSLATDAVFADAPFYVLQFLARVLDHNKDCHVILMTGTPRPVDWLFTLLKEQLEDDNDANFLDIYQECRHIEPRHVILERRLSASFDIVQELKKGKRILYFARTIKGIKELYERLTKDKELKKIGISSHNIGIAYADSRANQKREKEGMQDSERKAPTSLGNDEGEDYTEESKWFSAETLKLKDEIRASIEENGIIPGEIKILLTTSTFKEGVDICNEDIKVVFAESMIPAELVQMAGRLRKGIDELRVLYSLQDSKGFDNIDYERYIDECCLSEVNNTYQEYYIKQIKEYDVNSYGEKRLSPPANAIYSYGESKEDLEKLIALIHHKFPNIRYDYFSDKFVLYKGKIEGNNYLIDAFERVSRYQRRWWIDVPVDPDDGEWFFVSGRTYFQSFFPYSKIELWDRRNATLKVQRLLMEENCLDVDISAAKRDEIIQKIRDSIDIEILEKAQKDPERPPKQPKKYMEMFGIVLEETPGKRKGSSYRMSFISGEKNQEDEELINEW